MNYKPTILYVEDEAGIRENVKRPLGYFSSELYIACDGKEGLALYKEHLPDIVVTDIKMPNMSGIEMSQAIKAINPKQYIIITTAHNESGFFMNAIEMHIDAYVLKPIDIELLESHVERITEQIQIKKNLEAQIILTEEISQLQDNYLIVLDVDEKIIFGNNKFLNAFNVKDLDKFIQKYTSLQTLFVQGDEYFHPKEDDEYSWVEQLQNIENEKRVICLSDMREENKVFIVSLATIESSSHTIITFTEITTLELQKNIFKEKAYRDELTQIYNRTYFEEIFDKETAYYERENRALSFIMLDVDNFKSFNDTYGHQVGDEILFELAHLIQERVRETDTFARWGGEEFVLILPHATLEVAVGVAEKTRELIASHIFKNDLKITCSFGVTSFKSGDRQKSVMKRADNALYRAKESGRNRVES